VVIDGDVTVPPYTDWSQSDTALAGASRSTTAGAAGGPDHHDEFAAALK
jgi:hypothetical protein